MKVSFRIIFAAVSALALCTGGIHIAYATTPIVILAVGDSLTYSPKNPPEQSYPALLEKYLIQRGYDVQIVNAGVE